MLLAEVRVPQAGGAADYVLSAAAAAAAAVAADAASSETVEKADAVHGSAKTEDTKKKKEEPPAFSPHLFPTNVIYSLMALASKGDMRARLSQRLDVAEGFGPLLSSMQRDALLIRALAHAGRVGGGGGAAAATEEEASQFVVLIPMAVPSPTSSSMLLADERKQLQRLLEGAESAALPAQLRTVAVGIGVRLALALVASWNSVAVLNDLVIAAAASEGAERDLQPLIDRRAGALRSGLMNRGYGAEDVCASYTIGNEKWAMGIVGDSLHMRRSLERIQSVRVAHAMNNAVVQCAMIGLRGLMTFVFARCRLEARLK